MTETQSPKFKRWQKALLAFGLLAGLGLLTFWFLTTATFWQQVGWRLVAAVQDRVNAEVSAGKISGNLLTGMVFSDVKISLPQGDLIRVKELEVSLSLLSLLKLQPVIRTLAFRQPEVFLRQDADGSWNYANFLKPTPPPPFSQIHLSGIQIQNGLIQVDRPGQHQLFQDMSARLDLTIQAPGQPRQAVLINHGSIGFTSPPYPRLQADFALTYSTEEIQFQRAEITLADIPVLSLHGKIVNLVDAPALDLSLNLPELSGPQLRQLWPEWPPEFSARADLAIQGPLDHLKVTGSGALHNCQWQVAGSWQTSGAARPEFALTVNFQNLTAQLLAALYPGIRQVECFTHLNGALTVTGHGLPWPPDNLQARLELRPFSYGQAKIEAAALTLKSLKDLQILVLKLQGNFGRLETEVNGHLLQPLLSRTNTTGEIKISAGDFNPALLLGDKAPQGSLTAKFAGNFQLPPVFDKCQTRLSGKLQASGTLLQYAFQEFSLTGALEDGELLLNPARLLMHNLRAEAQGRLSLANADLKLSLDLLPPGPWPLLPPDLKGQFRTSGTIKGDWQSLAYQFDLQGKDLFWQQLGLASLQGKTSGTASRDTFRISSFDILAQNLTTPVGRLGQIHAIGQTRGSDLVFDLKTPKSQGQAGALAGTASWEQGATLIKISRFQWGLPKFQVASVQPVTVSIGPGRFEISPLRLQYQKAFFSLNGKLTNEVVSLQAKLENLRVEDIAKFLPQISDVKGVIDAQADVAGPSGAPSVKVQMNVASIQIDKFSIASFQSNWLYRDNLLTLNGRVQEKSDKAAIAWQGTSPLTLSLLPWSWRLPESGLQLRLWSDNVNMSLLAALIPGVSASEGPLNLQAQVTGSFLHPLFAGTLRYGPGSLTIQPSGAPLAIEAGELRLQGNRLILPRLIFHSGDGSGEITGGASLANLHLQDVQLNLRASNLLIIQRDGSRAVANGQVSLKGSWPDFRTDGRLTVNDGQFRLSFFRSPQNSDIVLLPRESPPPAAGSSPVTTAGVVKNFLINLVIDIPGGVWLRDKEVNGEIEGQIKVLRQLNGPTYLGGWVKAKEGKFTLNNKVFNVEKAKLLFPGEPHKPIIIDARAERKVDEYTLYVIATGPVDNPRTRLESSPPLSPRDQLSLLVFDHLADKMTREEYVSMTQKAMGILGSLTAQKLQTLLGGLLPFLGEVSPTTSTEGVGVGKKLGKDFTVSYEHKLNPLPGEDLNQIRLDYKLNKYFHAETQIGKKNTGGDIFFNIDF